MRMPVLERVVQRAEERRRRTTERCELCSAPIDAEHRHLHDAQERSVRCICRACGLLFNREAASRGHYRLVPQRRVRLPEVAPAELGVPVGLAWFVRTDAGSIRAHYPSPMGTTQWEVDPQPWQRVLARSPALATLAPEVEALLVNTAGGQRQCWLLPVDDCYRLSAVVIREWRGLTGGDRVWPAIDDFFAQLTERS
jgi:hypothetical protein